MDLFDGLVKLNGNHLEFVDDEHHLVGVTLDEAGMDKLHWLAKSRMENVFSHTTKEWELFFGPYINGRETGYILQAINVYSRHVSSLTIRFGECVDMETVKSWFRALLAE